MLNAPTTNQGQFYEHLTQSVAEGLLVLDHEGLISSANQAAAAIVGMEPIEIINRPIQQLWQEAPTPWDPTVFQGSQLEETRLLHENGRLIPARIVFSPIKAANNTDITLLTITSLDDVKQLNHALAHTQRLSSLGTLTASIAHELNTPISIIAATCSNLQHEIEHESLGPEQLLKYMQMIEQSAWRSARILEVLRNYSYNDKPQFDVTNFNMIVEDALALVRHQFRGQYNIQIEKELGENLPTLVCDHHRMTQVLLNLLINASDAIPDEGGCVKIKTWLPEPAYSGNGSTPESLFAFSIEDSGSGIDDTVKDKIFKPFFTTKPHGKGTGLGLYIAKRIVDQHNGTIIAENNDGDQKGATFTVIIPRNLQATV
ncbi:MAG: ATP-binding protein [Chloroflexota bacterium]